MNHDKYLRPCAALAVWTCLLSAGLTCAAAETVRFERRAPKPGDTAQQNVQFDLHLILTIKQADKTVSTSDRTLARRQERTITVLKAGGDVVHQATIAFATSEQSESMRGQKPETLKDPVAGKSYRVTRKPDDELEVTDLAGQPVSELEAQIVGLTMDVLGRPNPVAQFFAGRSLDVGQSVALPNELANDLLGFRDAIGDVKLFRMDLKQLRQQPEGRLAVFTTTIEADSALNDKGRLLMRGELAMEPSTCRVVAMQIVCPVEVTERRGPDEAPYDVHGKGTIQVRMKASHPQTVARSSR
jgi:hypothetical protein